MTTRSGPKAERGFTLLEMVISASLISLIFYMALSGYVGTLRGSATGMSSLESMVNCARALTDMNLELQEASVRDESIQIFPVDAGTGELVDDPIDPTTVPPPFTIYPTPASVGTDSFALRFMTIGDFTAVGDAVTIEEAGPYMYRLGTGEADDFPRTHLMRIDQGGTDLPQVLCRGVQQVVFQRDARGGAILLTLTVQSRDVVTGQQLTTRQVLTVTPKNDFSANLSNFDLNGEEI